MYILFSLYFSIILLKWQSPSQHGSHMMQFILIGNSHHFQQYRHRHIEPRVYNMTSICLLTSSHLTANIFFGSVTFFSNFVLFLICLFSSCSFWDTFFWELGGNFVKQPGYLQGQRGPAVLHQRVSWVQCRCQSQNSSHSLTYQLTTNSLKG